MTYFYITDLVECGTTFFVPDQTTVDDNIPLNCVIGGLEEANAKLIEFQNKYLEQESYRFSIAKEVVDGFNTVWTAADLINDAEEGVYHVFNTVTGLHEQVSGLTNAKARMEAIKREFIIFLGFDKVNQISELPPKQAEYSEERYGKTIGKIPVEIM
jgi:hypothetical protein